MTRVFRPQQQGFQFSEEGFGSDHRIISDRPRSDAGAHDQPRDLSFTSTMRRYVDGFKELRAGACWRAGRNPANKPKGLWKSPPLVAGLCRIGHRIQFRMLRAADPSSRRGRATRPASRGDLSATTGSLPPPANFFTTLSAVFPTCCQSSRSHIPASPNFSRIALRQDCRCALEGRSLAPVYALNVAMEPLHAAQEVFEIGTSHVFC